MNWWPWSGNVGPSSSETRMRRSTGRGTELLANDGSHALIGEQLKQSAVLDAPVHDDGCVDSIPNGVRRRLKLRHHPSRDRPILYERRYV
mmetsp:Transcript_7622/g.28743  ORF Transcript_7622/g.28743 Transcript_7622/m.28743 type:complete len:90 (-) Transcript_7622:859-1128(-)